MNELKEAALRYASMGLKVLPLKPKDKSPITKNGYKNATTDIDQINKWWSENPNANIGIATGNMSDGLVVIDMDIDTEKGKDGYQSFRNWCNEQNITLPESWKSKTGRGGYHLFYKSHLPVPSKVNWLDSVDIRANGGLIVVPPSVHPNGTKYTWINDPLGHSLATTTDSNVAFLMNSIVTANKEKNSTARGAKGIPEGKRNDTIFKLACKYLKSGMSYSDAEHSLKGINAKQCNPPLSETEVDRILSSANNYSLNNTKVSSVEKITEADLDMPTLVDFEEREKEWLVQGYIPKGCVTLLCSDGGVGKTTLWCHLLASFTTGRPTIFDEVNPCPFQTGTSHDVMYFSKEDPTEEVLKAKLRKAGADQKRIRCFGLDDDRLSKIWYGSELLSMLTEKYRPDIVVFDTLQAFLPAGVDMVKRKDMRDSLNPLNELGAKYGTSFLIVMHTNKSSNSGRRRMADSSDVWDLGRSVLMAGQTREENIMYLSHEKCNYGPLQKTILFSITDSGIKFKGTTNKKDRDYVDEQIKTKIIGAKLAEAKDFIINNVDKPIKVGELETMGIAAGITKGTLANARAELVKEKKSKDSKPWFWL